jgi:restriction system protein
MNHVFDGFTRALIPTLISMWPLWLLIGVYLSIQFAIAKYKKQRLARAGIYEIDRMDGILFERYLVSLFERLGYNVEHTPARGDYGADLIITKDNVRTAVQTKRHKHKVDGKAIQQVFTAQKMYRCTKAMVVTNSRYTAPARHLAKTNDVLLWDRDDLVKAILNTQPRSIK